MKENRKKVLIDSINSSLAVLISDKQGSVVIHDFFQIHEVGSINELSSAELEDMFGLLFQYEVDCKE